MVRILACGETLVGLATATASLPSFSTQSDLAGWLLLGFLGLLPTAYRLAAGILAGVANESPCFVLDDAATCSRNIRAPLS